MENIIIEAGLHSLRHSAVSFMRAPDTAKTRPKRLWAILQPKYIISTRTLMSTLWRMRLMRFHPIRAWRLAESKISKLVDLIMDGQKTLTRNALEKRLREHL